MTGTGRWPGRTRRWPRDAGSLEPVMALMEAGFPAEYGERWSATQLAALLVGDPAAWIATDDGDPPDGFALARTVLDEAELMLLAVRPAARRRGLARRLVAAVAAEARGRGAHRVFAEVRDGNDALALYLALGFEIVGRRPRYYRGPDGRALDALTVQLSVKSRSDEH